MMSNDIIKKYNEALSTTQISDIIISPYIKVLDKLKEIKKYFNSLQDNKKTSYIKDIDWIIYSISNFTLYSYTLINVRMLHKYKKENNKINQIVELVNSYNSDIRKLNIKNYQIMTKIINFQVENSYNFPNLILMKKGSQNTNSSNNNNNSNNNQDENSLKKSFKSVDLKFPMFKKINKNNITKNRLDQHSNKIHLKNQTDFDSETSCNKYTNTSHVIQCQSKNLNNVNISTISRNIKLERKTNCLNYIENANLANKNKVTFDSSNLSKNSYTQDYKSKGSSIFQVTQKSAEIKTFKQIEVILKSNCFDIDEIFTKSFNIFKLRDLIKYENVLPIMGKAILDKFGITSKEKLINVNKLESFLFTLSGTYNKSVLYHNAIHGSDVTHTICLIFLNSICISNFKLSHLDVMGIIIGALGHDVGHPGFNNNFQINSESEMAITYNDISCLENFHTSTLYKILHQSENNIFDVLSNDEYKKLRKRIVSMILATDMAIHKLVISKITDMVSKLKENSNNTKTELPEINIDSTDKKNNNLNLLDEKDEKILTEKQQILLDYVIHAADLGHNTKDFKLSLKWVQLLSEESWNQGDQERFLNLPISMLCDRNDVDIPKSQIGFINFVIIPTFDILVTLFPSLKYTVDNAKDNVDRWKELVDLKRKRGWTPNKKDDTENDPLEDINNITIKSVYNKKNKKNNNNSFNEKYKLIVIRKNKIPNIDVEKINENS